MNDSTDKQLIRDFSRGESEEVFEELVRRHVDLVYSVALRMVRDAHLAEDVTQSVFVGLSQNAARLVDCDILLGWLYRTTRNLAANAVRSDVRRRSREQEVATMNEISSEKTENLWEEIAPKLEDALDDLTESDRAAILLHYFERKPMTEIAEAFSISNDAAKKRVNRAVERLRNFFAKRGISIGASGLVAVVSANAVQAAPVGLVTTISAATFSGASIAAATLTTSAKAVSMTTLQKSVATVALAAVVGTPLVFQQQTLNDLRSENENLAQVVAQVDALREENANLAYRDSLARELAQLQRNHEEILRLREEVAALNSAENTERIRLSQELERINHEAELLANEGRIADQTTKELMNLVNYLNQFADEHGNRYPTSLDEIIDDPGLKKVQVEDLSKYEFYSNPSVNTAQRSGIVLREKVPRLLRSGEWLRTYVLANGRVTTAISDTPDFSNWEQSQASRRLPNGRGGAVFRPPTDRP